MNALTESIEHWECIRNIVFIKSIDLLILEGWRDVSCALCDKYLNIDCVGCPVYIKTNEKFCLGSPWVNFDDLVTSEPLYWDKILLAAEKELEFLRRL